MDNANDEEFDIMYCVELPQTQYARRVIVSTISKTYFSNYLNTF